MRRLGRVWRLLHSTGTASWLLLGLAVAAGFGSWFPQVPGDPASQPLWQTALRDRYGGLGDLLGALGLTHFHSGLWFWLPALALLASLAVCTAARFRSILRSATLCSHVLPFVVVAGILVTARCAERQRLEVVAGDAPRAVQLRRWSCGRLLRTTSGPPSAPAADGVAAAQVAVTGWQVDRTPDGQPLGYRAELTVELPDGATCSGETRVNHPFRCRGYSVVLLGAASSRPAASQGGSDSPGLSRLPPDAEVELVIVRDPGYPLVVAGLAGLVVTASTSLVRPRRWRRSRPGEGSAR